MSASATNARSTAMPPPVNALKRKTLVERGGEYTRPSPAPPSSRPGNAYVRATAITGAPREISSSYSVSSSRPSSSTSTRNISNSSYASSVGPGTRPPTTHSNRPQSAMSYSRVQKPVATLGRPATALEAHDEEPYIDRNDGRRKGRTPFPTNPPDPPSIHPPKVRGRCSSEMNSAPKGDSRPYRVVSAREASLNTRFHHLSLQPTTTAMAGGDRSPSPVASCARPAPIAETDEDCLPSPSVLHEGLPKTPSHIPKLASTRVALAAETPSPSKAPKKTPKPLSRFLNRGTNTTIAFDTDSRLEDVENCMSEFKEKLDGATIESRGLKDMMAVYKIRSTWRAGLFANL